MSEFKAGQRVKVEYEATIQSAGSHSLYVCRDDRASYWIDPAKFKVTVLDPPDWPPQVGDIWATKDGEKPVKEWFARHNRSDSRQIVMTAEDGKVFFDLEPFKTLNPVLVRRRGE
jgi:hypothetical protein